MEWRERISTDPAVCHRQACIMGTRIPIAVVLDNLGAGRSAEEIVASCPLLGVDDFRAATAYAAERERVAGIGLRGAARADENLSHETSDPLNRASHDAVSVGQQGLAGARLRVGSRQPNSSALRLSG
jgi:uncharacterized protein (DUF433 family)